MVVKILFLLNSNFFKLFFEIKDEIIETIKLLKVERKTDINSKFNFFFVVTTEQQR